MAEILIGLLLFLAAIEDFFHQKIFDGFAVGIAFISIMSQTISVAHLPISVVLIALSFIPPGRPCWGRGDGFILAALSLHYDFSTIVFFLSMGTLVLFCVQVFLSLKHSAQIALGPALFIAWLAHFLL